MRAAEVDHRAVKVILAILGVEERELAEDMGYTPGYVSNVLNGFVDASEAFRRAFGAAVADLIFGPSQNHWRIRRRSRSLTSSIRRAATAADKSQFYADLGVDPSGRRVCSRSSWLDQAEGLLRARRPPRGIFIRNVEAGVA